MSQFQSLNALVEAGEKQFPRVAGSRGKPAAAPTSAHDVQSAAKAARRLTQAPPGPRDYWIFDQVVRRGRKEVDVAEDMRLSQPRVSQICTNVGAWLDRIGDECLPGVQEEELRAVRFLFNLRLRAKAHGLVPADEDIALAVERVLGQLAGIEPQHV